MSYDYSQAGYSPEILEYLTGLDQQRTDLWQKYAGQNVGLDDPDILKPKQVQQEASDGFTTQYAPEDVVRAYMAQHPDNAQNNLNAGVDVRSYGDSRDPSVYDTVRLPFGDNYTFTNKATGQTYNASTPEQLQAVRQAVSGLSTIGTAPMKDSTFGGGNNSANWEISNGAGERIAYDSPYTPSFLKQAGQTLADIGTDYVLPALGAAVAGPLGAGFTTAAVKGGKGASLEDALKAGGLSALTSYGMSQLGPYINSSLADAGVDFPGMNTLFPAETPSFWGAAGTPSSVAPNFSGPSSPAFSGTPGMVAPVFTGPSSSIFSGADRSVSLPPGAFNGGSQYLGSTNGVESAVVRPDLKALSVSFPGLNAAQLAQLAQYLMPEGSSDNYTGQTEEAVVSADKLKPFDVSALPVVAGVGALGLGALSSSLAAPSVSDATPVKEASTLSQVLKYSPLALALLGAAGGSGGAGGADGGTGVYHAPEKLPDIFSAKLPSYNALPSYAPATANTGSNSGGAYQNEEDWYTYGRRPEKSFFSNIPGTPIGRAKGGSISARDSAQQPRSLAVKGPGTGRSDDIPARLSDGEYVMDAETVALLGDGSSKAGADRLDRFRVNVRKHKGKSLAAGRFSVAAKQPEAYLKGRK